MDYSVNPWWVYAIAVVGVFAVVIGLPILGIVSSSRRSRRQSVSIENGNVYIVDSAFGGRKVVAAESIGTVVYLPEREADTVVAPITSVPLATSSEDYRKAQARSFGNGANMFEYGGLILLDTRGRMVGHVAYEVGSHAPLATVWKQIPAQNHVQAPLKKSGTGYSRKAFKQAFPRALRFGQMWGSTRWTWTIVGFVVIGIPVLGFITLFVWVFVDTWISFYG